MTYAATTSVGPREETGARISVVGSRVLRYGLVLVVGWIGLMKFTEYEAKGIQPLVAHSPFLGWMYDIWTVRQFSVGLGVVEVGIAFARRWLLGRVVGADVRARAANYHDAVHSDGRAADVHVGDRFRPAQAEVRVEGVERATGEAALLRWIK